MSQSDASSDPHLADCIARAETRRRMLERLTEIGMAIAEEMGAWASQGLAFREDPGKSFAAVSRGVRLSLVLQARIDKQILAMRKGTWPPRVAAEPAPPTGREQVGERKRGEGEAREALERVRESLIEREGFSAFLALPFREALAVIFAEFGVQPDWSDWSDGAEFVPERETSGAPRSTSAIAGPSAAASAEIADMDIGTPRRCPDIRIAPHRRE